MAQTNRNANSRSAGLGAPRKEKHPHTRSGRSGDPSWPRKPVIDFDGDFLVTGGGSKGKGKAGPADSEDPGLTRDVSKLLEQLSREGKGESDRSSKRVSSPVAMRGVKRKHSTQKASNVGKKSERGKKTDAPLPPSPTNLAPSAKSVKLSSTPAAQKQAKQLKSNSRPIFIVEPTPQWYAVAPDLPISSAAKKPSAASAAADTLSVLSARAASLHAADTDLFQHSSESKSVSGSIPGDASFLQRVLHEGTLSDRLGALTLLVQASPVHNVRALETLRGLAARGRGAGGRGDALRALRCVVDWWVGGGAPPRKLRYFREQPLDDPGVTDQHLVLWHFEDWLKKYFFSILQLLEKLCLDPLSYVRTQALTLVFTLLRDKPEQEQNLLRLLVNKLGDAEKSVCSRASYYLLQLLQVHPAMKAVVVREVTSLILRPMASSTPSAPTTSHTSPIAASQSKHVRFTNDRKGDSTTTQSKSKYAPDDTRKKAAGGNAHAQYYATITFNQIVLTPADREVALELMDVYFEMFKELLDVRGAGVEEEMGKGDGDGGEKNVKGKEKEKETRVDRKGRVVDNQKKGKGKGRMLEVKGAAGFAEVEDARSKLISAILTGINRAAPFARIDSGDARLNKHIDTLFLITHKSTFNISLQALVLIQHISTSLSSSLSAALTSKSVTDRYYRALYASLHDSRLGTSAKQAMYLNLFFKSIKSDPDPSGERAKALVRRFVQVLVSGGNGGTEFVAGGLFLLGEIEKLFSTVPGLRDMLGSTADGEHGGEDDEIYDPRKRDPQYARASSSPLWELTLLQRHYHPTISLYARQLLSSQPLTASADLSLNTLSHFLDRFVYKNPKKPKKTGAETAVGGGGKGKGMSAMQPAATGVDGTGVKLLKGEVGDVEVVHGEKFLRRKLEDVPVDQIFFHRYFTKKREMEKAESGNMRQEKVRDEADEEEDEKSGEEGEEVETGEDNDEVEAEIWKAMKATMPTAGDLPDEDVDVDEMSSDSEGAGDDTNEQESDLAEGSDDEDLISLGDDLPNGLIEYDGSSEGEGDEEEAWGGVGDMNEDGRKGKRRERREGEGSARKKLKSLPTFASYEDYAAMIEAEDIALHIS